MFAESRQVVVIKLSDQLVSEVWLLVISDMFLDVLGFHWSVSESIPMLWHCSLGDIVDVQTCKHTLDLGQDLVQPMADTFPYTAFLCFLWGQANSL